MANIVRMLKPGGRIMHMQPMNNYVNHGFYQFSLPFTLIITRQSVRKLAWIFVRTWLQAPWGGRLYALDPRCLPQQIASGDPLKSMAIFFIAENRFIHD